MNLWLPGLHVFYCKGEREREMVENNMEAKSLYSKIYTEYIYTRTHCLRKQTKKLC